MYELSLLAGITAVDDHVGLLHQTFDDFKLLLDATVVDELDAEAGWYHGQAAERPTLPLGSVVVRLLQGAQVSEGPRHLVSVTLHISIALGVGTQHVGNILCYAWLLRYTDDHIQLSTVFGPRR